MSPVGSVSTYLTYSDCNRAASHAEFRTAGNITKKIYAQNGILGLWRGTLPTLARCAPVRRSTFTDQPLTRPFHLSRNVPGVAIYFWTLQALRQEFTKIPIFAVANGDGSNKGSALPTLSSQGNLVAGVTARLGVGLLLNPFAVLKARYEVSPVLSRGTRR